MDRPRLTEKVVRGVLQALAAFPVGTTPLQSDLGVCRTWAENMAAWYRAGGRAQSHVGRRRQPPPQGKRRRRRRA
jgi:hypothetical protein